MAAPVESIVKLDDALSGVPFDFAFLGGSVLSLLVTDKTADAIRVTKDVDVMVDVKNRREFHAAERILESRGFKHGLFNGRASIAEEIAADEHLAGVLGRKFAEYLAAPELEDAIDGFVLTEPDPPKRKADILSRIQRVADLAQGMLE